VLKILHIIGKEEEMPQQLTVPVALRESPGTLDKLVLPLRFCAEIIKRVGSSFGQ